MSKSANPFGATLADVEAYYANVPQYRVHNEPLRDVSTQDFWDFAGETVPAEDNIFSPGVIGALREVLA